MTYLKSDYLNDILSYYTRYYNNILYNKIICRLNNYSEIISCIRKAFSKIIS